ncbi:alpha/beta hydrolase, partial [Amycolatopsis sp. SID8362]|nr:alpha/beta hydrolase [Amycolatopsis sp. SID8362]NED44000.1 alpha/beta hydrolase [Amycolatopsis sp. SID8362]
THVRAAAALAAPADFTDFRGVDTLTRASVLLALGRSPATLRSASPLTYPAAGAPPFLVAGGRKAAEFAEHLRQAGVPVTTAPDVAAFFTTALR